MWKDQQACVYVSGFSCTFQRPCNVIPFFMPQPITIAADRGIPFIEDACAELGSLLMYDVRDGNSLRDALSGADVLLCRSTIRVDERLLGGTRVRFVATATSGTDHFDIPWLEAAGIAWVSAAGSNARSVAEWLAAVLLEMHVRGDVDLRGADVGIVGVGHVGSQVADVARALGLRTVLTDPPREERSERPLPWSDASFSPLAAALGCRICTLHTPLTATGAHPTRHMISSAQLSALPPGALLVNAARGAVFDADAAMRWRREGEGRLVLDVFPGEPAVDPALVAAADIATPHVAGHALDGKLLGTQMVYDALCAWLGHPATWRHESRLPDAGELSIPSGHRASTASEDEASPDGDGDSAAAENASSRTVAADDPLGDVHAVVMQACPLLRDDASFRGTMPLPPDGRAAAFKSLRAEYPVRREFRRFRIRTESLSAEAALILQALGFAQA